MIKHVATSELTFGHMPAAPPPRTGEPDAVEIPEMLECFTEQGFPADTSVLSPIAVVCSCMHTLGICTVELPIKALEIASCSMDPLYIKDLGNTFVLFRVYFRVSFIGGGVYCIIR